jgi:hypothetical protein
LKFIFGEKPATSPIFTAYLDDDGDFRVDVQVGTSKSTVLFISASDGVIRPFYLNSSEVKDFDAAGFDLDGSYLRFSPQD